MYEWNNMQQNNTGNYDGRKEKEKSKNEEHCKASIGRRKSQAIWVGE